jgi:hypothetical protein
MSLLRVYSSWITVLLLLVTLSSLLPATPFKNFNRESAGAATGSEPTTSHVPAAFQLDREAIVLERLETPSTAAPIASVTFTNISQANITNFAAAIEFHHSDVLHRQHTLRI